MIEAVRARPVFCFLSVTRQHKLFMPSQFGGGFSPPTSCTLFHLKTSKPANFGPQTQAIHGGEPNRHGVNGPIVTEIIRSSTFTFSSTEEMKLWAEGKNKAYIYTRYGNPTLSVAEKKIAALEGAEAAVVTSSGMAAISSALLAALKCGDEVISTAQLYVGSPTNPTLRLVDIHKAVAFAKKHNLVSIIDNTFATPVLQNPIALGYDMVVHSATKGLAGHSDIIAGVAVGNSNWMERVRQMIIYLGGSMDPGAAYLLIRGIKTLGVRVERQCENAIAVAKFLENHSKVEHVHYPGLKSHADHKLARKQMRGFGSMLAFDLKGGLPAARRFCDRVRLFLLAASLGGVESLVILPIYSSHYNMTEEELRRAGVSPGTVRVSLGLEDKEDLIEDLKQALA